MSECLDFETNFLPCKANFRRNMWHISRKFNEAWGKIRQKTSVRDFLSKAPSCHVGLNRHVGLSRHMGLS